MGHDNAASCVGAGGMDLIVSVDGVRLADILILDKGWSVREVL